MGSAQTHKFPGLVAALVRPVLVILMFGQVVILGSQQLELKVQVCFNVTHKKISRIQDQTTISSK